MKSRKESPMESLDKFGSKLLDKCRAKCFRGIRLGFDEATALGITLGVPNETQWWDSGRILEGISEGIF